MIRNARPLTACAAALVSLAACASPGSAPAPVRPLVGPNEQVVETNFTAALECVASYVDGQSYPPPRIAVGHITDLTGATDYFAGRRITQGAALMAMTALADAGMRVVERYDMGVIEVELNYAQNGLVRDSEQTLREVQAGQLQGSDLYIVGGITEFNPNIRSSAAEISVDGLGEEDGVGRIGGNSYTIDVGIDLRLVDVRSSEVLSVRSFRKQVIGRERSAGVFEFIGGNVVDFNAGQRALEPVQTAVRTMVDRAVFEFVAALYGLDQRRCLDAASDHAIEASGMRRRGGDAHALRTAALPTPQTSPAPAPAPRPQPAPQMASAPATGLQPAQPGMTMTAPTGASAPRAASGPMTVLLSTHRSRQSALNEWDAVSRQAGAVLAENRPFIHRVDQGVGGAEYRLLAGPAMAAPSAVRLCERLSAMGQSCTPYDAERETQMAARAQDLRAQLR